MPQKAAPFLNPESDNRENNYAPLPFPLHDNTVDTTVPLYIWEHILTLYHFFPTSRHQRFLTNSHILFLSIE